MAMIQLMLQLLRSVFSLPARLWHGLLTLLRMLYDPISSTMLPIVDGISRRGLLRIGIHEHATRINGTLLHYYYAPARGPRHDPPFVLVHGLADNALTWALTIWPLANTADVYALDLPGYGFSALPRDQRFQNVDQIEQSLVDFIEHVAGGPVILVGNSLGGWVGARLAARHPELLIGLALLNPGGAPLEGHPSWDPFIELCGVPDLQSVRRIYRRMFGYVPSVMYLAQRSFQRIFQREIVQSFMRTVDEYALLTADELRRIRVPTILMWGLADHFLPAGSYEFFQEHLPDAERVLLRGCGHLTQRERPLSVVSFLRRFYERLVPADPARAS